jgi:hypothetical protein
VLAILNLLADLNLLAVLNQWAVLNQRPRPFAPISTESVQALRTALERLQNSKQANANRRVAWQRMIGP